MRYLLYFVLMAAVQGGIAQNKPTIADIKARIAKATPCPWKSDGSVVGWWNGEQSGVAIRAEVNRYPAGTSCVVDGKGKESNCQSAYSDGSPVAMIPSTHGWSISGSHDPVADADFVAHSCEDTKFLLKLIESKPAKPSNVSSGKTVYKHCGTGCDVYENGKVEYRAICNGGDGDGDWDTKDSRCHYPRQTAARPWKNHPVWLTQQPDETLYEANHWKRIPEKSPAPKPDDVDHDTNVQPTKFRNQYAMMVCKKDGESRWPDSDKQRLDDYCKQIGGLLTASDSPAPQPLVEKAVETISEVKNWRDCPGDASIGYSSSADKPYTCYVPAKCPKRPGYFVFLLPDESTGEKMCVLVPKAKP